MKPSASEAPLQEMLPTSPVEGTLNKSQVLLAIKAPRSLFACGGGGGGANLNGKPTPAVAPVAGTILGVVADKISVRVAGVTITVYQHKNNIAVTAITDANGSYSFPGQNTGNFSNHSVYV